MRRTLGTAVFAGMIGVTLFGIFLTPVFFFVLMYFGGRVRNTTTPMPQVPGEEHTTPDERAAGGPKVRDRLSETERTGTRRGVREAEP